MSSPIFVISPVLDVVDVARDARRWTHGCSSFMNAIIATSFGGRAAENNKHIVVIPKHGAVNVRRRVDVIDEIIPKVLYTYISVISAKLSVRGYLLGRDNAVFDWNDVGVIFRIILQFHRQNPE